MGVPGNANALLLTSAAAAGGYQVSRSLRFNAGDSAFLSKSFGSAGDRKKWTWSCWLKRSALGSQQTLFDGYTDGSNRTQLMLEADNTIRILNLVGGSVTTNLITTAVFRDPSAWYHVLIAWDTAQGTSSNRVKVYINGTEQTSFSTATYPGLNENSFINAANAHDIGRTGAYTEAYLGGYLADIWFLDGIAATPSDFAETDATTGQWSPKAYAGSKPGNSFHLDFSDNSAATAAALGKDSSGNNNNWSPSNFQVVNQTNYVSGSSTYRQSTSANQNWNSSSSASSTSSALSPDRIFWVDLGSSQSFNKVTFTCVAANNTGNYASNFIVYYSTSGSSTGSSICNGGCTVTKVPVTSGPTPGTITVEFSGISAVSGQYIGITNGTGADTGTYTYSNLQVALSNPQNNDSLVDTPTSVSATDTGIGGEIRGNYCTWNPLAKNSALNLANGNLDDSTGTPGIDGIGLGTIGASVGKFYWELTVNSTSGGNNPIIGVVPTSAGLIEVGSNNANSVGYLQSGSKRINGSTTSYGNSFTTGDVVGVALDLDNGAIYFSKNGTWQNSGVPTSGSSKTGAAHTWTGGSVEMTPAIREYNSSCSANWGQRSWAYQAPAGFKALCDTNLGTPTIIKPSTVMDVALYTGNFSSKTITGLAFQSDLVWIKTRGPYAGDHNLFDAVRGTGNRLRSNTTDQEDAYGGLTAFNSSGFTLEAKGAVNGSGESYVAWCFDAGATTTISTAGSITSSLRANASAGFSIVTYTGTGSNATIGHGLGVAPKFIIVKCRSSSPTGWPVYHTSIGTSTNNFIELHSTAAASNDNTAFQNTAPTSSVFYVGTKFGTNASSETFVAYVFSPVAGYSSAFSFTGNGSSDGPFCFLGFRPRFLIIKRTDAAYGWYMYDTARDTYNIAGKELLANASDAEVSDSDLDILSNGFKPRRSSLAFNASGGTFIGFAWAESPFQYARAR